MSLSTPGQGKGILSRFDASFVGITVSWKLFGHAKSPPPT